MIDVMLVLLVIVLTTATFISQGVIRVALPKAENSVPNSAKKIDEILISSHGKFYFNNQLVTIGKLENITKLKERNSPFLIKSDKDSKFNDFVKVIDILKSQKKENVAIATIKKG